MEILQEELNVGVRLIPGSPEFKCKKKIKIKTKTFYVPSLTNYIPAGIQET